MRGSVISIIAALFVSACSDVPTDPAYSPKGEALPQAGLSPKGEPIGATNAGYQPAMGQSHSVAPQNAPSAQQADQFARQFLNTIQARSFAGRREYCGYFIVDNAGRLSATPPTPGTFASCEMPIPQSGQGVFASYHTHGAYGPNYDNEVPSTADLLSDFEFGIDGYVSTPGGRVWRVEFDDRSTVQVCGQGCVAVDPGFVPQGEQFIRSRYTVPELRARSNAN